MKAGGNDQHDIDLVVELTDHLVIVEPMLRLDVVSAALARLAEGRHPTALDLAGTLVAHFA
jgi:hypothetical protein